MEDPSSGMRYPAGMKGFTLPDNQIWLDECWKTVAEQSVNHTVEIPRGTSRGDAATLMHRAAAKQIRAIDYEGLQAHRETLDMKASKEAFISSCNSMLTSSREVQHDARLGLEVPQQETRDQTLVEVKVEQLYHFSFESLREELVQHDERLGKEREDAKRRGADLCSQRPGDLLQNLVQTSVTKALTDLGHVTDTQDESEEVDGEKITQAIANTTRRNGQSPGGGQGHNTKGKGMKKKKTTEKQRHSQGERQRARARTGTSANEKRKPEEARQEEQNQGLGQGQGQRERNKPSKQTTMERVSTRRKGKRERRQRKRITSAVNRRFTSLVQGATETDLCLLLDESSWRNGVYTYDHEAKRCITCESVPWPVAWVLERFNLKHRHVHKPPSAGSVRERCVDLERKVLWRWHRDTKGFLDGDAPWRISNMPVAEYPKLPSPELRLWLSSLGQAVMGAIKRVKNMYAQGCGMRNMLGITRLGFKMLRESEICAMPWDNAHHPFLALSRPDVWADVLCSPAEG